MSDPYTSVPDSLIAPARHAFQVTPQDNVDLSLPAKALYVGSAGDISLRAVGSSTPVLLRNVPNGSVLAIRVAEIRATGTTATDIIGLI